VYPDRVPVPRFVGGTNMLVSRQMSDERSINFYPETTRGGGKVARGLRPAEGITPLLEVLGQVDCVASFFQNSQMFAVVGTSFVEIFSDWTYIQRGTVLYDGNPGTIVSNGSAGEQVCICVAYQVYIYDLAAQTLTLVPDFSGIDIAMVEFMDGYFFALRRDTRRVYYSGLEDGTVWDLTFNYIERSWGSDNIQAVKRSGRQLWLVGSQTSEVWADNGNATIPFAPIQGAFLDVGASDRFSCQRDGETLIWLTQDERGGGLVVRATGYDPSQISTLAIDAQIQAVDFTEAEAFVIQTTGHKFYWLNIPALDTSLVFDFAEQEWHERARWNATLGEWVQHPARVHCYGFGEHVVGVRNSGVLYKLSPNVLDNVVVP
jgi:hypothetical protein